jgi:hypothetical protein
MTEQRPQPDATGRLAPAGGWLVIVGPCLLLVPVAFAIAGQPVAIGGLGAGGAMLAIALAVTAVGFALLAVAGPPVIVGRVARIGFALLAIGLGCIVLSSAIAGGMTSDPLGELAFVLPFLLGGLATVVGIPVTVIGLLLRPGAARRVAAIFLAGLAVVVASAILSDAQLADDPGASSMALPAELLALVGLGLMLLGVVALGVVVVRGSRGPEAVPA